ncbi:MAG: NYN domain-containing protein [Candidatus Chromulinivorax sp.]
MIILIDAYNLFKTVLHVQSISDKELQNFLHFFDRYAQSKPHHQLILVFDGGPRLEEHYEQYAYLQLIYSGTIQIADQVLIKKMHEYRSHEVLLVTCDRQIRKQAAAYQIESLGSIEFYTIIQNLLQPELIEESRVAHRMHKMSDEQNDELDALMEFGSRKLLVKDQDKIIKISSKQLVHAEKYVSKKDKKLLKKIMKL